MRGQPLMEVNDQKLEGELAEFSDIVQEEFSFLVDDYGFMNKGLERLAFEYPIDKHVKIDYLNDVLCVRITWYLTEATMGVGLIELENGKIPAKFSYWEKEGFSRAIGLSTLVKFLTNGEVKHPLPDAGPTAGARKMTKAMEERKKLIEQDMRGILATFSGWLRTYASDILARDTSIFGPVQRYEKEQIAKYYPGYWDRFS